MSDVPNQLLAYATASYYYLSNKIIYGPVTAQKIQELYQTQAIQPADKIWIDAIEGNGTPLQETELGEVLSKNLPLPKGAIQFNNVTEGMLQPYSPAKPAEPAEESWQRAEQIEFDTFRYQDIRALKYTTIFFLLLPMLMGFCFGIAFRASLLTRHDLSFLGIVTIVLVLPAGFFYLCWLYRACANAHALGAKGLEFSPGWAVGCYFVPLLNLLMPYYALQEIWKASTSPKNWQSQPGNSKIRLYWLTNVFGIVAMGLAVFLLQSALTTGDTAALQSTAWMLLAAAFASLLAIIFQCAVIAAITNRQIQTVEGPTQGSSARAAKAAPNPLE